MRSRKPDDFRSMPSATGGIARLACASLRKRGRDVRVLLSRAGLTVEQVDDPANRLHVHTQIKVLELAAEDLQDDFLGFHLARSFDLRTIGLLYYVMASSERLADALSNVERYCRIMNEGVRLRVQFGRATVISLDYVHVNRRFERHQIEFWVITLVRVCQQLTNSRMVPRQLRLRHFRDRAPADCKSLLGGDIRFDAGTDEIVFAGRIASLPIVGADTHLNKLLRKYADEALASRAPARSSVRSDVERTLPELLPHGRANISEVGRRLGVSGRTLSRTLLAEAVTFTAIVEELRDALARRYLRDRELPISEIAWLLGYREVSSFTHAFKRWTGMTPRQFRSAARIQR
jgi:AraC-like DNA-binding protein